MCLQLLYANNFSENLARKVWNIMDLILANDHLEKCEDIEQKLQVLMTVSAIAWSYHQLVIDWFKQNLGRFTSFTSLATESLSTSNND